MNSTPRNARATVQSIAGTFKRSAGNVTPFRPFQPEEMTPESTAAADKFFLDLHLVIQSTNPKHLGHGFTKDHVWSWFEEAWERVEANFDGTTNRDGLFLHEFAALLSEAKGKLVTMRAEQEEAQNQHRQTMENHKAMAQAAGITDEELEAQIQAVREESKLQAAAGPK